MGVVDLGWVQLGSEFSCLTWVGKRLWLQSLEGGLAEGWSKMASLTCLVNSARCQLVLAVD